MSRMATRLARLERGTLEDRETPEWWAIRKWFGNALTAEQEIAVTKYEAAQPAYDPAAPVDSRGWSPELREWLGYHGPRRQSHVPEPKCGRI